MALDLSTLRKSRESKKIHPRDIFTSLPRKPFSRLRLEQGEVLQRWFDRRNERDLLIKQNTGGGKTVVGLLMAQSSLNEGMGPVTYLTPDTFLARQVISQADALGIPTCESPRDLDFLAGDSVLVTTFQKLVNGRSVFGLAGSTKVVEIGTMIVDDVHTSLAKVRENFRLIIPRQSIDSNTDEISENPAYASAISLLSDYLKRQNLRVFNAIEAGDTSGVLRVPSWAWHDKFAEMTRLLETVNTEEQGQGSFAWSYPLTADYLQNAEVTITATHLEIQPECVPIEVVPSFGRAQRRIYMTATLADDGSLVELLDADPASIRNPITPGRASDLGTRLILAPLELNQNAQLNEIMQMSKRFADGTAFAGDGPAIRPVNVAVLVPSKAAAAKWQPYADMTVSADNIDGAVEAMRASHVGLVVFISKYDGIDLPGEACRLLVLDGLPGALSPSERYEVGALHGSSWFKARIVQWTEQGMGRGVRDNEDYCAVLLLGEQLAVTQASPTYRELFSPATRAQMDISRDVSAQLRDKALPSVESSLSLFLSDDTEFRDICADATVAVEYPKESMFSSESIEFRNAFNQARVSNFEKAASDLNLAANSVQDTQLRGWMRQRAVTYFDLFDRDRAQGVQRAAKRENPNLVLPDTLAAQPRISAAAVQAEACSLALSRLGESSTVIRLGLLDIASSITWNPDLVDTTESAIERLGAMLGFNSLRPDLLWNQGPDNLWVTSAGDAAAIECKSGVVREHAAIVRHESGQLHVSSQWVFDHFEGAKRVTPVILHPSQEFDRGANLPTGCRVITPANLDDLKDALAKFADEVSTRNAWSDSNSVRTILSKFKFSGSTFFETYASAAVVVG